MKYLLLLFLVQLIAANTFANPAQSYKKAKKQYILEYTVFGVDECLSKNQDRLVVDKTKLSTGKILVGSKEYFNMLATCFHNINSTCTGESCIVTESMQKRIEGIRHVEKHLSKF